MTCPYSQPPILYLYRGVQGTCGYQHALETLVQVDALGSNIVRKDEDPESALVLVEVLTSTIRAAFVRPECKASISM